LNRQGEGKRRDTRTSAYISIDGKKGRRKGSERGECCFEVGIEALQERGRMVGPLGRKKESPELAVERRRLTVAKEIWTKKGSGNSRSLSKKRNLRGGKRD